MKGKELLTLAVALVLALALTGCAPKDAGVAILTGLDKKELAQGDLPCRSYYEGETLMVPLCEVARALCYLVPGWRLKLHATAWVYFTASLRHMALLKGVFAMAAGLVLATLPFLGMLREPLPEE